MARDGKTKVATPPTAMDRKSMELTDWLLRKLCSEKFFPKRSRWLMSGKIADLTNDYQTDVDRANEIKVRTFAERDLRHFYQTKAMADLMALDRKVNQAIRVLELNPDDWGYYAGLVNENKRLIQAWITSDEKRYGSVNSVITAKPADE